MGSLPSQNPGGGSVVLSIQMETESLEVAVTTDTLNSNTEPSNIISGTEDVSPAPTDVLSVERDTLVVPPDPDKEVTTPADIPTADQESPGTKCTAEEAVATDTVTVVNGVGGEVVFDVDIKDPTSDKVLKASPEAIEFMADVGLEELGLCLFNESLQTFSEAGQELGSFTVSVQPAYHHPEGHDEERCFLVHASTHSTIDNIPTGSSIVAYISQNMETLEQHHHEFIKMKSHSVDKKTQMLRQEDHLVISTVITEGESVRRESVSHPLSSLEGLISEASNLLIMRLLARKKPSRELVFLTFDTEMNLCTSSYSELGSRSQVIGRDTVEVYGLERTVHSEDVPVTWQCYFLSDGHLASRVQVGSPAAVILTEMPVLSEAVECDPKPVFGKKPLIWQEDAELYSKFLDRKDELIADHETYLRRHPELRLLLADFMQFLLLRKPTDVFTFAAEFFGPFSVAQTGGEPFCSSKVPSPFKIT
uniref:Ciliogenesis-associated TTC17-interacting protein n=1 Tax=Leptobrachium leishanense TaxID=445787 RepID=A0A8C5MYJ4_9ANUR